MSAGAGLVSLCRNVSIALILWKSFSDGDDYTGQAATCTFPVEAVAGDTQCLSIPILDNSTPDGNREFSVLLMTFDPLVQIIPGQNISSVTIIDNDST